MGEKGSIVKNKLYRLSDFRSIIVLFCFIFCCVGGCGNNEKEVNSNNLNPCEVHECSKDGTNEIIGISGEKEYYCDEHYNDMKDMAQKIIDDVKDNNIDDEDDEDDELDDTKIDSEKQESEVYQTYTTAANLKKDKLTKTSKGYSYNGLDLLQEDCDWIDNSLNEFGTVNQGAIYRKIAKLLQGFEMKISNYQNFSEILIGFIPETRNDFVPYAENAMTFITEEDSFKNIMKKFESLSCVNGNFDYESGELGQYSFEINDLTKCVEEMQISEEMLGYIFALLDEYAPEIEFNDNTCLFSYCNDDESEEIEQISEIDFIAEYEDEEHDILKVLDENGKGYFQYFAFDASVDELKEGVITTHRGIYIGAAKVEVIEKYGETDEFVVDLDKDELYQAFLYEGNELEDLMKNQCYSYIEYPYGDKSIRFYFDEANEVSWIVYLNI